VLIGASGAVDGLAISYTGTAIGAVGDMTIGVGAAALFEGSLDTFSNSFTGMLQKSIDESQKTYDSLGKQISDSQLQLEIKRKTLTQSFARMESAMSVFQSVGAFLTQNTNAGSKNG